MNGIHDLGGMHGFGRVPVTDDAAFHARWEREMYGLNVVCLALGLYNSHESRHATEQVPPAAYLTTTYFERWLASKPTLLYEKGILDEEAVDDRAAALAAGDVSFDEFRGRTSPLGGRDGPLTAEAAREAIRRPKLSGREAADPQFEEGEAVVVRNHHPEGHTRIPGYARRAQGVVEEVLGTFPVADALAHGDDRMEPCYHVRFSARELWGAEHDSGDTVTLDMCESYLQSPE